MQMCTLSQSLCAVLDWGVAVNFMFGVFKSKLDLHEYLHHHRLGLEKRVLVIGSVQHVEQFSNVPILCTE